MPSRDLHIGVSRGPLNLHQRTRAPQPCPTLASPRAGRNIGPRTLGSPELRVARADAQRVLPPSTAQERLADQNQPHARSSGAPKKLKSDVSQSPPPTGLTTTRPAPRARNPVSSRPRGKLGEMCFACRGKGVVMANRRPSSGGRPVRRPSQGASLPRPLHPRLRVRAVPACHAGHWPWRDETGSAPRPARTC